ncbi:hypothetical protein CAPTEDRAFT_201208 [Capitella teleta]|uniref:Uncharacterized protein n=1 Tax=Capitella teleta TaxID=283909 RepID=R7UBW0_CAPTE|nr:hypothetical protein CAPTEDRAFT_201208 [Capitella teleta]|eukprot:ELU01288.1 hypothetical protein CAPTEDRAFT_201208 [Capitella teleta]
MQLTFGSRFKVLLDVSIELEDGAADLIEVAIHPEGFDLIEGGKQTVVNEPAKDIWLALTAGQLAVGIGGPKHGTKFTSQATSIKSITDVRVVSNNNFLKLDGVLCSMTQGQVTSDQCKDEVIYPRWNFPGRYKVPISYILFKSLHLHLLVEIAFEEHAQPGIKFKDESIFIGTKVIQQLSSNYWYALTDNQVKFGSGLIVGENELYTEETGATVIGDIIVIHRINYLQMSGSLCEVQHKQCINETKAGETGSFFLEENQMRFARLDLFPFVMVSIFFAFEDQSFNTISLSFRAYEGTSDLSRLSENGYPGKHFDGRQDTYWVALIGGRLKCGYGDAIGENVLFTSNATGVTRIGLVNIDSSGSDIVISGMTCPGFCITRKILLPKLSLLL